MANTWPIHFLNLKFYTQTCSQVLSVLQIVNWTHTFACIEPLQPLLLLPTSNYVKLTKVFTVVAGLTAAEPHGSV